MGLPFFYIWGGGGQRFIPLLFPQKNILGLPTKPDVLGGQVSLDGGWIFIGEPGGWFGLAMFIDFYFPIFHFSGKL